MKNLLPHVIRFGFVFLIWFSALAHAAYDLWAATIFFLCVTILSVLFCVHRIQTQAPISLPLLIPVLLFLGAVLISGQHAYDHDVFRQKAWEWFFCILVFYVFMNSISSLDDARRFFRWAAAILIPLAVLCVGEQWSQWKTVLGDSSATFWAMLKFGVNSFYKHWEIHGPLVNSIILSGFALYWPLILLRELNTSRWILGPLASVAVILVLGRSFWALISLILGMALLGVHDSSWKTWAPWKKKSVLAAGACLILFFAAIKWRQPHEAEIYMGSGRLFYWLTALRVWKHHFWTGVGIGGFPMAFLFYKAGPAQSSLFAHSVLFQWIAETGAIGILAAGVLAWRATLSGRNAGNYLYAPYAATLIMVGWFSLANFNMEYLLNKFIFVLIAASTIDPAAHRSYSIKPFWLIIAGTSLILISPLWIENFRASQLNVSGQTFERQGQFVKAIKAYQDSLSLDGAEADSADGLSRIFWIAFLKTHNIKAYHESLFYLQWAIHERKDPALIRNVSRYTLSS